MRWGMTPPAYWPENYWPFCDGSTPDLVSDNVAIIEGIIMPSSDGTVIARFASEIASSAITAKAGSFVEYEVIE